MKQFYRTLLLLSALALCACTAHDKTSSDQKDGDWQVMTLTPKKGAMLCYAGTTPTHSKGVTEDRGKAYLMITRRASGKIEVSASSGYPYRQGSKVDLVIDGKVHALFFKDNVAWATDDEEDRKILATLKKAKIIEVRGFTQSKHKTMDYYSAEGFMDALARVKELCP